MIAPPRLLGRGGKAEPESGTAALGVVAADRTFVGFDNSAAGGEPQAGAVFLGGEERAEQLCSRVTRQAGAVVDHRHSNSVTIAGGLDPHLRLLAGWPSHFERVLHQRIQNVLNAPAIDRYQRQL